MILKIETYNGKFDNEIISRILSIQNDEAKEYLYQMMKFDLLKKSLSWIREQSLNIDCIESLANHDPDIIPHVICL